MSKLKEKLNLVEWGDLHFPVEINKCKKCGGLLERIDAMGIVAMGVCKKCNRFYGLVIEDITGKLKLSFKKKFKSLITK